MYVYVCICMYMYTCMHVCMYACMIPNDHEVAETLNSFFDNAVRTLNIQAPINFMNTIGNIKDSVQAAILKYANHPNILKIKVITKTPFSFQNVSMNEIQIEL